MLGLVAAEAAPDFKAFKAAGLTPPPSVQSIAEHYCAFFEGLPMRPQDQAPSSPERAALRASVAAQHAAWNSTDRTTFFNGFAMAGPCVSSTPFYLAVEYTFQNYGAL